MNTTPLLSPAGPTMDQLFGNNYEEAYLRHLPEQVNFNKPIIPRIDFHSTRKNMRKFVNNYNLQLEGKYPKVPGKTRMKNHPMFNQLHIIHTTEAVFVCLLEMFTGFCNVMREGATPRIFTVRPSAIASRCNIASINTVNDHLDKLKEAGMIIKGEMNFNQSYNISFNPSLLTALPDRNYRDVVCEMILTKCPELAKSEDFQKWTMRLNPSFFACSNPSSPQFLSMYLLKQELNNNTHKRNLLIVGETVGFPPHPLPGQEQGSTGINTAAAAVTAPLGAKNFPAGPIGQNKKIVSEDEVLNFHVDTAFRLAIGTLSMWWYDKIKAGTITEKQISTAKMFIRYWLKQDYVKHKLSYRDYIDKIFLPTLYNQRSALLKVNYGWIPYLDKYFDPQWRCNDGSPAGYVKATMMLENLQEQFKKKKPKIGTKEKIRRAKKREEVFSKLFFQVMRNPSEKNYLKAEQEIRLLKDKNLLDVFIKSIQSTKLLTAKFIEHRKIILAKTGI